jgi:hypothetical protein
MLGSPHERPERLSRRQAHKLRAAAAIVRIINTGSVVRNRPSPKIRQICARKIRPKTAPVVMRYAFIGFALQIGGSCISVAAAERGNRTSGALAPSRLEVIASFSHNNNESSAHGKDNCRNDDELLERQCDASVGEDKRPCHARGEQDDKKQPGITAVL